ncbi:hypothetical protein [Pseudonocardia spinosispora]|uniref:hypothetical protein n=1 Tax=Pseudonocardia spinosispora TaxID=103441 RepID=UPI00040B6488|nr:hypothetical protein [Pseudonocardia spinosispora]
MSTLDTPRPASGTDVSELAAVLARAFQFDPVTSWIMPDDERRRRNLPGIYVRQLSTWFIVHGVTEVCHRDGQIVAGTLWSTP